MAPLSGAEPVHVGIVQASHPGKPIQPFLPPSYVRGLQGRCPEARVHIPSDNNVRSFAWNGFYAPLHNLAISAVLWWQGEADTAMPRAYHCKLTQLIAAWRAKLRSPKNRPLFVTIVQLHAFVPSTREKIVRLREQQAQVAMLVANTSVVTAVDICRPEAHPADKTRPARRSAKALSDALHGQMRRVYGPVLEGFELRNEAGGGTVIELRFASDFLAPALILPSSEQVACASHPPFEITREPCTAAAPEAWESVHKVSFEPNKHVVLLSLPAGKSPTLLRYASSLAPRCMVYTDASRIWPLLPFRQALVGNCKV
eukprot:TRINITY_DN15074_c0_g1_i1.p2 TRINITY_DN15074_c0_g1~~TRINITY_DN15074_c0_g1_i1.p2  ORF type:complete len:314 (+),score=23.40 TRINITY_DN15074_c0_g1_i1:899-1840(+)